MLVRGIAYTAMPFIWHCLILGENLRNKSSVISPYLFDETDMTRDMLCSRSPEGGVKGKKAVPGCPSGGVRITRLCRAHEVLAAKMRIEQRWSSIITSFPAPGAPSRPGALCPEEVTK